MHNIKKFLLLTISLIFLNTNLYSFDISGALTDIETKKGVEGIKIEALEIFSGQKFIAKTDINGKYAFFGLNDNERYYLRAIADDIKGAIIPLIKQVNSKSKDLDKVDFLFYKECKLTGYISSESLQKLDCINLIFKSQSPFYDYKSVAINEEGKFIVDLIYDQEYTISAFCDSNISYFAANPSSVIPLESNENKNILITPTFYAVGRVFNTETGKGISSLKIVAVSTDGTRNISAQSSSDGSFILSGLNYGKDYTITLTNNDDYEYESIQTGIVKSTITDLKIPVMKNQKKSKK